MALRTVSSTSLPLPSWFFQLPLNLAMLPIDSQLSVRQRNPKYVLKAPVVAKRTFGDLQFNDADDSAVVGTAQIGILNSGDTVGDHGRANVGICVASPDHACGGGVVDGCPVEPAGCLALVLSGLDGRGEILGPGCCKGHGVAAH